MIDLEREKKNFQNHVATFTDYGNIKILDFKRPDSDEYRIRFLLRKIIADYIYLVILDILRQAITVICDSGHLRSISQVTLDILMEKLTAWTETNITLMKNRLGKISMNT